MQAEDPFPSKGYLKPWRQHAMLAVLAVCRRDPALCRERDLYEFGVYTGRALKAMARWMEHRSSNFTIGTLWGFDSFMGLSRDAEPELAAAAAAPAAANLRNNNLRTADTSRSSEAPPRGGRGASGRAKPSGRYESIVASWVTHGALPHRAPCHLPLGALLRPCTSHVAMHHEMCGTGG